MDLYHLAYPHKLTAYKTVIQKGENGGPYTGNYDLYADYSRDVGFLCSKFTVSNVFKHTHRKYIIDNFYNALVANSQLKLI